MNKTLLSTLLTFLLLLSCEKDESESKKQVHFTPGPLKVYRIKGTTMGFLKPVNVAVSSKGDTFILSAPGFPETSFELKNASSTNVANTTRLIGSRLSMDMQTETHKITFNCSDVGSQKELFKQIGRSIMEPLITFDSLSIKEGELVNQFETERYYRKSCNELTQYLKKAQRFDPSYKVVNYHFDHTVDMDGKTVYTGYGSEVEYGACNSSTFIKEAKELLKKATAQADLCECTYSAHFTFLN